MTDYFRQLLVPHEDVWPRVSSANPLVPALYFRLPLLDNPIGNLNLKLTQVCNDPK